ncbi:DUF5343 domain-containing protein [Bradyrhizobium sp. CER78]|uniref:DUF5343 domain-containing protein n=1 Tax=Bradyrhizobium sp. CER78 TaxID=3039162 RepID=UPI00244998C2|nr:DUF5343 domain-containing protein [Bradyrhizobium sp. CER78]MDH2384564.1 DUF5343 domain-containing protein [Bradyrhizobium sp. CER78]
MPSLPYVSSPGNIVKALNGIKTAAVPDRVSQDFVKTILKIPGGSGDQMTTFLKKLGLTNPDGSPNEVYRKFRNPASSGLAMAAAIRSAYAPLYVRNEFMHELNDADLLGLVVEETGEAHDSNPVKLTVSCIKHLKQFANFNSKSEQELTPILKSDEPAREKSEPTQEQLPSRAFGINLGYTINLNLPATADPNVFDAIFKSLKEHLLRAQDG